MNDNDIITYCKPGLQKKRFQKLKNGALKIHFEIDLHGKTLAEANDFLDMHIHSLLEKNFNCGLIIHGKGYNSGPDGPKLKSFVQSYLIEHKNTLGFHSASPKDGGTGALYVLFKKHKEEKNEKSI